MMKLQALLFDCDGVLAETERDGHRVAYNRAMQDAGISEQWSPEEYAELVRISGGKERLRFFFEKNPEKFPPDIFGRDMIENIYSSKTVIFKEMVQEGLLLPRTGILRLITEAHEKNVLLFVCSTSHRESVETLIRKNYGDTCFGWFAGVFCGDIVARKKPAPDIYILAAEKHSLQPDRCCVIEDSRNGLLAAKNAGMHCVITRSYYTAGEDFSEADLVVSSLGDPGGERSEISADSPAAAGQGYISIADIDILL
ncbi:HAD-IA family hydrolase [Breznakiella homolactica]|uniref:HAD-IA family hydrolase n=1 Tax=Breznakiella homolactica TaxID=2798577 RepID=A0A7T8B957_9SPIR|nr:HAD-IA family hydrolase [Breznakiella homolactica]QQO08102.1 HAD-IA family hydrolase [Breznakiella homolactica]